jgi:hypothetical protein
MKSFSSQIIALICLFLVRSNAFPNGNLENSCQNMMPQHGSFKAKFVNPGIGIFVENLGYKGDFVVNQRLAGLYSFFFIQVKFDLIFSEFQVIVNSSETAFKGFMLQVKEANKSNAIPSDKGYWEPADTNSKTLDCFSISKSVLVHRQSTEKNSMTAYWVPTKKINDPLIVV